MEILVGGIESFLLKMKIRPVFDELGFSELNYHLKFTPEDSEKLMETKEKIDLMILSGWKDNKYQEFYDLSVNNPKIPSILLIDNTQQGAMEVYGNIHPPSWTAYFSEFDGITRRKMDAIL